MTSHQPPGHGCGWWGSRFPSFFYQKRKVLTLLGLPFGCGPQGPLSDRCGSNAISAVALGRRDAIASSILVPVGDDRGAKLYS